MANQEDYRSQVHARLEGEGWRYLRDDEDVGIELRPLPEGIILRCGMRRDDGGDCDGTLIATLTSDLYEFEEKGTKGPEGAGGDEGSTAMCVCPRCQTEHLILIDRTRVFIREWSGGIEEQDEG